MFINWVKKHSIINFYRPKPLKNLAAKQPQYGQKQKVINYNYLSRQRSFHTLQLDNRKVLTFPLVQQLILRRWRHCRYTYDH